MVKKMYQVVWTKRSLLHLKQIYDYISEDSPKNALKVVTDSSVPLRGTIKENKLPLITQMNTDVFQC